MAILKNMATDTYFPLRYHHTFGRKKESVNTHVNAPEISGIHVSISWNGSFWELMDKSRNGTFVNDQRIEVGTRNRLNADSVISLGSSGQQKFQVIDVSEPVPIVFPKEDVRAYQQINAMKILPNDDNPVISIFFDGTDWILEKTTESEILNNEHDFIVEDSEWSFFNPRNHEQTIDLQMKQKPTSQIEVHIHPSKDHESAQLILSRHNTDEENLGYKSQYYLLYLLANSRKQDIEGGVDEKDAGWIGMDLLCRMLKQEVNYINIQVYRLRKELSGFPGLNLSPNQIIERRKGALRIGADRLKVA